MAFDLDEEELKFTQKLNGANKETIEDYQRTYCRSVNESISKQKIKDKIEELEKNELLQKTNYEQIKFTLEVLEELLQEGNK